jgi:hypothetical protein
MTQKLPLELQLEGGVWELQHCWQLQVKELDKNVRAWSLHLHNKSVLK